MGTNIVGAGTTPCSAGGSLAAGVSCDVKCDSDLKGSGTTTYSCDNNGKLTASTLQCSAGSCNLPATLGIGIQGGDNSPCSASSTLDVGETCNVKCETDYVSNSGSSSYSCDDGKLTQATLKCSPPACKIPASLGSGIKGGSSAPCAANASLGSGDTCNVDCDTGYKSNNGTTTYNCNNGKLNAATLTCTPAGCSLPQSFGLDIIGDDSSPCIVGNALKSGDSCNLKCRRGYKMVSGVGTYSCRDGKMTPATIKCEPITCAVPQTFGTGIEASSANGCLGSSLGAGKSCYVQCSNGFKEVSGVGQYQCGDNGSLKKATLSCNPISCKLPMTFGNNIVSGDVEPCTPWGTLLGDKSCTTKCADGYELKSGEGVYSCSATGVLSNEKLQCVKSKVGKQGRAKSAEADVLRKIKFQCAPSVERVNNIIERKPHGYKSITPLVGKYSVYTFGN